MVTTALSGAAVARRLRRQFPRVVLEETADSVTVAGERIAEVAMFMRDDEEYDCKYLNTLLGVDWLEYFDVVYVISSLAKNHIFTLKARAGHDNPIVPSVNDVWMGANLQEREVYDLMGIAFSNHPALKRIFLWDGFPGHPLRKDFLALPGGFKPGLQRFPFEFPEGQRNYPETTDTNEPSAPAVPRVANNPPADQTEGQTGVEGMEPAGGQLGSRGGGVHGARSPRERDVTNPVPMQAGADQTDTGGQTPVTDDTSQTQTEGGSGAASDAPTKP